MTAWPVASEHERHWGTSHDLFRIVEILLVEAVVLNPTVLLLALVGWLASAGGAFWYGTNVGEDHQVAIEAAIEKTVVATREAGQQGAAKAIAKIEVKNVTINRQLETTVRDNPVFRDCRSGDDSVRLYNSAIPGYAEPASGGVVPAAVAPSR
jgi:hypothetical protein